MAKTPDFLKPPLFLLGQLVATNSVGALMSNTNIDFIALVRRHVIGDWGDIDNEDKQKNNLAVKHDNFILSSYDIKPGLTIWIKTEWDRSVTTIMLPADW